MLILSVIHSLGSGGAEKQLLIISRELAARGHQCRVVALARAPAHRRTEGLVAAARQAGVTVVRPGDGLSRGAGRPGRALRLLRGAPQPVLWAWGMRAALLGGVLSLGAPRARFVLALRDANGPRIERQRLLHRLLDRRVALYLGNSWYNCELVAEVARGALRRSRVVYNALDAADLAQAPAALPAALDQVAVVLLGSPRIWKKGYDCVLELGRRAMTAGVPIAFRIAGRGDEVPRLRQMIAEQGLEGTVFYDGEAADPYAFLARGQVYLLMSRYEGLPNSLLEAMNLGLPCIATKVGDLPRLMQDRVHLRLVEIADVDAVWNALLDFRQNWAQARALGQAGRELCRARFTAAAAADGVEQAFAGLWSPA